MNRLAVTAAVGLVLCVFAPAAHALEVVARDQDGGRSIVLRRGDVLRVSLRENPSTGFAWRTVAAPVKRVLLRRSNRYVAPAQTSPPAVGAPGRREVTWRAVGRGTTRLTMRLFPPGSDEPTSTFRLVVEVR